MSAVRRNDRRATRHNLSSPYARPSVAHPPKKYTWSLSGLISFLNPFGGNHEPEDSDMSSPSDGEIEQGSPPRRFSPPQLPLPPLPPPPQQQLSPIPPRPSTTNTSPGLVAQSSHYQPFSLGVPSPSSAPPGSSLAKNLEPVTRFLVEKAGQPLNEFEAAGIVDYIQKSVQGSTTITDKPEPFRFSVSPSRATSPNHIQGARSTETPRKTLSRNPNGVYRWQGAGSSRPRNRYQSPGFAPRPQQHRIKLSPPKTPLTTDTKRRRVGDEAESATPQKPVAPLAVIAEYPVSPSPRPGTILNGRTAIPSTSAPTQPATPKPNVAQPRVRTSGLVMKPTTPAIPSPLRQAWKESDSPPQASPPSRPTRAADFMTELIKEVTPTKKPDVSNPYQTASPVKPPAPVRKPMTKRPKPTARLAEKPKEQEPEISAQAIIEATVPKGTKRSRPVVATEKPNHGGHVSESKPIASEVNGFSDTIRSTYDVVEILEDEEGPSKRRKTPPTRLSPQAQESDNASPSEVVVHPAEIVEPADDYIHINGKPTPPSVTRSVFSGLKTSAPKEPSKLRYSFHADKVEVKNVDVAPAPPLSSLFALPVPLPTIPGTTTGPSEAKLSPKEKALAMSVDALPKYTFPVGTISSSSAGPSFSVARNSVLSLAVTSLPTYTFNPTIPSARAMNGFNWTAAGLKAPTAAASTWNCSLCGLQNPAGAKEKCTICDAPRQGPPHTSLPFPTPLPAPTSNLVMVPPPKGFNWSAAGLARPSLPESGTWSCQLCGLQNPADATEKCAICDAPRQGPPPSAPSLAPASAPTSSSSVVTSPSNPLDKGFNWSAAGLAPPPEPSSGTWTCSVCLLSNTVGTADKCSICDAPR